MTRLSIALALVALSTCAQSAEPREPVLGTVARIVDGDTLDAQLDSGKIRIRLHGVDAPEKNQPYGKEAAAVLSSLVLNKQVEIEPVSQDRYERMVAIVHIGNDTVNAALVRTGNAWAYRRYMRKSDAYLCELEADSRKAKRE